MTIMFAGGMTLAIPGFLPDSAIPIEAFADQGTSSGSLYISSTLVQGAQVIQVIVDDPALSTTGDNSIVEIDVTPVGGSTETVPMFQVSGGTYQAFLVDDVSAENADGISSTSMDFGVDCDLTLAVPEGFTINGTDTFIEEDSCTNPDATTKGTPFSVLQTELEELAAGSAGQPGPATIANIPAGYGDVDAQTWPVIYGFDFAIGDNLVEYGGDAIMFSWGQQESPTAIYSSHNIVVPGQKIHLTIEDNGLNIDPTTIDVWTFLATSGSEETDRSHVSSTDLNGSLGKLGFGENGTLTITESTSISSDNLSVEATTADTFVFTETGTNTGVFTTHNVLGDSDASVLKTCTVDDEVSWAYGGDSVTLVCATGNATSSLDAGAEWEVNEPAAYSVTDPDMNRNSVLAESLDIQENNVIPTIKVGSLYKYLERGYMASVTGGHSGLSFSSDDAFGSGSSSVANTNDDSGRIIATLTAGTGATTSVMTINTGWNANTLTGAEMLFYDICSIADHLNSTAIAVTMDGTAVIEPGPNACSGTVQYSSGTTVLDGDAAVALVFTITHASMTGTAGDYVIAADLHHYDQGVDASGIYRMEAEETGPNTGTFEGTVSYIVGNTVYGETAMADWVTVEGTDLVILIDDDKTGTGAPRVNFGDTDVLGSTNVTIGSQLDALTHTGTISFDLSNYSVGDEATVTVVDPDLNMDSSIVETYVGDSSYTAGTDMFSVTCNDAVCSTDITILFVEDGPDSDTFISVITVPDDLGEDLEVGYHDSRNASDTATIYYATSTIGAETGTVSLDRQVYPVPFDANELKQGDFTANCDFNGETATCDDGDVTVWVYVTDGDFTDDELKVGASETSPGTINLITSGTTTAIYTFGGATASGTELGPMTETEQGSNVYEISFTVDETQSSHQVLGGSTVIQAKYADAASSNNQSANVFDSATFDLRNGTLTADKSVYVMGQTMILTLTDEDLNLDSDSAEGYTLDMIEWDSDANSSKLLGDGCSSSCTFTSNPSNLLDETGSNTGVFQTTIDIPDDSTELGTALELGEVITLTYRDAGRAGESSVSPVLASDTISEDVELEISISNFGASITLDKTVYDWTDTVNIEVVAPDHNKNENKREDIGTSSLPIKISTRHSQMCSTSYKLTESGENTGVFEGYIVLTGLASQKVNGGGTISTPDDTCGTDGATGGPENGKQPTAGQDDGITVTYEYDDGSVALASAIIQWNYSSIEWLESNVSANGGAVVRVVDPDEDLDDEVIDQVTVDVYSDSDSGGITKTLSETDEGTGVFEGLVSFTSSGISTGDILRVSEGDTVTAEVTDYNLPGPDYTSSDDLLFAATTTVGTAFPPLERAPAANARVVDASGNSVAEVSVDQQVQIAADVSNGQGKDQAFAYLVQVQDASGVTVSLSWLTGSLTSGQSMTAAQSWTPTSSGSYTATVFVWESVSNPTALSPTVSVNIDVV